MNIGIYNLFDDSTLLAAVENKWDLKLGDGVVFRHTGKELLGRVSFFDRDKVTNEIILDGEILRKVEKEDEDKQAARESDALSASDRAREIIKELKLPMQIMHAAMAFDQSEVNFFFAAEERVDFRELVPRLAGVLKKRVHLQQIGARDRAKMVGGYGPCGRELCCTSGVMAEFKSITMEMARLQELAMKGADNLSGSCGKLFCCLSYEVDEYKRLRRSMPEYGRKVMTPKGEAKVIGLDVLNQMVKVYIERDGVAFFPASECKSKSSGRTDPIKPKVK